MVGGTQRSDKLTGADRERPEAGRLAPAMAAAALASALLAVTLGGVVRVTGSGLGCPDWPLCYGRIVPPWELAAWIEYIHRLSAAVSGVFTLLMVVAVYANYGRRSRVFALAAAAGVFLLVQAALGAFTVLSEIEPGWALLHTGVAAGLVGLLALTAAQLVRPLWLHDGLQPGWNLGALRRSSTVLAAATFVMLLSGAYVTRSVGAPLACTTIPLCNVLPWDMTGPQWLHMAHRVIGLVVVLLMMGVAVHAIAARHPGLAAIAGFMASLLALQTTLGILNVVLKLPPDVRGSHLAAAMVFWAVAMLLAGSLHRGASGDSSLPPEPDGSWSTRGTG